MVTRCLHRIQSLGRRDRELGAALVVGLILLLVITVLGTAGLVSATLELQMSGNLEYQERAFQAAEFAIEQAINSPDLSTGHTLVDPMVVPASGTSPRVPGNSFDTYSYRLYYDTSAGSTPTPGGAAVGDYRVAYHFVVIGSGTSLRGSIDTHTQGFYVLGAPGCESIGATCDFVGTERRRTYWSHQVTE